MAHFLDRKDGVWTLALTFGAAERVQKHVKTYDGQPLDLLRAAENLEVVPLALDGRKMVEVVFWILWPEIRERSGATSEQAAADWWGDLIDGRAIRQMSQAFRESFLDFIQSPSVRDGLRKVLDAQDKLVETAATTAASEVCDALQGTDSQAGAESLSSGEELSV